ncbi:hypothetical protein EV426DRAFT_230699 [Tirmania nivea]|nr:hypothetical protein EV426DRAFT_230699 [Tirmania nivea]
MMADRELCFPGLPPRSQVGSWVHAQCLLPSILVRIPGYSCSHSTIATRLPPLRRLVSCASLSRDCDNIHSQPPLRFLTDTPRVLFVCVCVCVRVINYDYLFYQGYTIPIASFIRTTRVGMSVSIASIGSASSSPVSICYSYSTATAAARVTLRPVLRASTSTRNLSSSGNLIPPYLSARGFASTMAVNKIKVKNPIVAALLRNFRRCTYTNCLSW